MPLHLTDEQRRALATRLMLQGPANASPDTIKAHRRLIETRLNGIPGDVLFTLDALRLLADQGNVVAEDILNAEIERLGLTTPTRFGAPFG